MKNIAILAGGYSGESVISQQSAQVVMDNLDRTKYHPYVVWIDQSQWVVRHAGNTYPIDRNNFTAILPEGPLKFAGVFIAIHGSPGENGLLQGYFEMLGIPFNTCDALVAALTFNKAYCNNLLRHYGIRSAQSMLSLKSNPIPPETIGQTIGFPCFVKPNASGSSLGVSKVNRSEDLPGALANAFAEDDQVIIEAFIEGTELSCGTVSKDGRPQSLAVTEIVSENEFFDYQAKYEDDRTQEIVPARISPEHYAACMRLTEEIYDVLQCRGMIRADYILKGDDLYLIEVNTVPGLSEKSIIPQQALHAGLTLEAFFTAEVDQLFA